MKLKFDKLLFIFIIIIAIFFRFFDLSQVPPQPTVDEVSIGYNAYSILKTGADEYGTKFPVLLRAYDDWRPALYAYLVIPFVALFDLNVLAVRLPSAILGILGVLGVYFLTKELFKESKIKFEAPKGLPNLKLGIPEVTTLLLAISPWHVYISRLGHEVNASFTFLIFGMLFFFRFLNREKRPPTWSRWNMPFSALFFGLSFDSYQSTKIIIPLILLVLLGLYFRKIIEEKVVLFVSLVLGLVIISPVLLNTFDENALIRFKGTSLFENSPAYFETTNKRFFQDKINGDLIGVVFDNRKVASLLLVSGAYLSHFDPVWLFLNKGDEEFKAPNIGLLYLFELPLIFVSMFFLLRDSIGTKNKILIILLGLIAILPASITTGYPHAMRVFSFLPIPQIFAAAGFIFISSLIRNRNLKLTFYIGSALILLISLGLFFHSYFTLLPRELSHHFQYGVLDALKQADKMDEKYLRVVVSNRERLFESYMFYLYAKKYNPSSYQKMGGSVSGGFAQEHKIDNYIFGKIDDKIQRNTLYIINPGELTDDMNMLLEIKYKNKDTALLITEIK